MQLKVATERRRRVHSTIIDWSNIKRAREAPVEALQDKVTLLAKMTLDPAVRQQRKYNINEWDSQRDQIFTVTNQVQQELRSLRPANMEKCGELPRLNKLFFCRLGVEKFRRRDQIVQIRHRPINLQWSQTTPVQMVPRIEHIYFSGFQEQVLKVVPKNSPSFEVEKKKGNQS